MTTTTVRWGVVGPGGIADRFAEAMTLVPDGSIVAVASRSLARASAFADRHGAERRYDDVDALAADDGVDAVYVATPHSRHMSDTLACLSAGKSVLCEKPFALNRAQGQRMVEAAAKAGVFLMEAVWSRYLPVYRTLVSVIGEGRIGAPLVVDAEFGFRVPVDPSHRLFDPLQGGGALLDLGIYPIQLCTLVLGPVASCSGEAQLGSTGVDELVGAVLRHEGGGLGVVRAALVAQLACTARVSGTDGWISLPAPMHCASSLTIHRARGGDAETIDCRFEGNGLQHEIIEVHRCLREGLLESPTMPLEETLAHAAVMDTIRSQIGLRYPDEDEA